MAHSLTLTPVAAPNINVPDAGDERKAASVEVPFQAVGNWLQWLHQRLTGAAPIVANLDIDGSVDIQDQLSIGGYGASAIEALGDINTQGAIYAQNGALFDGLVEITEGGLSAPVLTASGNVMAGGNVTAVSVLATGSVNCLGVAAGTSGVATTGTLAASRGYKRRILNGPDADTTIIGANYDIVVSVLSANRTYTLSTSGAEEGMTIKFFNNTPASVNLNIEAGAHDAAVLPSKVAEYMFHDGIWQILTIT